MLFKNSASFKISPLNLAQNEQNQNRNYHLIINTIKIEKSKIPELNIKEKEPVFLYFNENLTSINLNYFENDNEIL